MAKVIWDGQWVIVRRGMNKKFHTLAPCSICNNLACNMVWFSLNTKEVRCKRCFTPEGY